MCGIVGLFCKSDAIADHLGEHLSRMLVQMNDRGPDSAGVAVYRDPVPSGSCKLTLQHEDPVYDFDALAAALARTFGGDPDVGRRATHAVLVVAAAAADVQAYVLEVHPEVRVMSVGSVIEIYKETGLPSAFAGRFCLGVIRASR